MPKAFDKWQVFPHRSIEKLEANLIVSHGKPMTDAPGEILKTVAARL